MVRSVLVLTVMFATAPVFGQGLPPIPFPPPQGDVAPVTSPAPTPPPLPLQVLAPTQRAVPFDRVMYVLDVSGSMRGSLAEAIRVTGVFASDDMKVSVVTFHDSHQRWDGVRESCETKHMRDEPHGRHCLEPGWCFIPKHNEELMSHLGSFGGTGGTDPTSALEYAYKNAPAGTLIVLVSDGQDMGAPIMTTASNAIRQAKAWRAARKMDPVQMLVWATSEEDSKRESLRILAELGGGGLWRADSRRSGPW